MFEKELFTLCHKRQVFIRRAHEAQFIETCQEHGILCNGGILTEMDKCFYLDKKITLEEARYISIFKQRVGVFDYLISKGKSPFSALAELDLL